MRTVLTYLLFALTPLLLIGCDAEMNSDSSDNQDVVDAPAVPEGQESAPESATGEEPAESEDASASDDVIALAPDVVATVNGDPLAMADFQRQAFDTQRYFVERGLDPNTEEGRQELLTLRRQVLIDMINQLLIEQAASEMGIAVGPEEAAASLAVHEEEAGGPEAFAASLDAAGTTREDVLEMERTSIMGQRFVDNLTSDVPSEAEFVHARHILCAEAQACQDALARLDGGEDFETVAADVSIDEVTAERGGDLDWIPRVEGISYLPSAEMEAALSSLGSGELSEVISSAFGFHVLEVVEIDSNRELSDDLRFQLVDKAVQDWLAARRGAADIVIYLEDLRDIVGG